MSTLLDLTHGQLMLGLMHKVNFYIQQLLEMLDMDKDDNQARGRVS